VPSGVPSRAEKAENPTLSAVADLLIGLPESERQSVIADLPVDERTQIARLLVRRQAAK